MDNYIPYGAGKNMAVVNQLQPDQTKIDNNEGNQGLGALSVGQQIEGLVVSVDDNVTLDFGGHQIAASKEIMKDAVPGDVEMFRVEKLKNNVIELKLINKSTATSSRGSAVLRLNIDSLLFMGRKEQSTNANRKEKGIQDTNNIIDKIASDITLNDIAQIEKDGFQVEKLTVDGLYEAMKRAKEAKHHTSQSKKTSDQQSNTTGNGAVNKAGGKVSKQQVSMNEKEVAGRLTEGNVPATKENVQNVMTALGQSNAVSKMDDRTMKYLISNELEPTIGNIYKACYSQNSNKQEQVQPLSDKAWNDLKPQVAQVISDAGFEVNDANLNTGKWLIENKLPVTQQSFTYKKELDDMKSSVDQNKVLDKVVDGMKEGISPKEVSLKTNTDIPHGQLLSDIHKIKDNTILYAVHEKSDLTIKNLMRIQNNDMKDPSVMKEYEGRTIDTTSLPEDSSSSEITGQSMDLPSDQDTMNSAKNITNDTEESTNITDDPSKASNGTTDNSDQSPDNSAEDKNLPIEAVKAKRQLEEIRLKMTAESATKLEKMGIQVDTQRLEKVVEALRELEDNYYKGLLKEADAVTSQENVQVLKETTQSVEQLKSIPSFILGATLPQRSIQTIPNLLSEGSSLQAQLTKAGTAYETLMTVPSKEYGDSIQKAFRNMESMLSEMNIENTQLNQRAVRILGYNQMDITQENIDQVKAYDMQVNTLIQNLNPAVAVRMIKDGINPLDVPIGELNQKVDQIKEEQGITSEDKFSTYLQKLEKDNSITPEERKAYIGIYRLLHNIEKTDGAAVGTLVKTNREVTLNHLLSAVQTLRKGSMDTAVNDDFGLLQGKIFKNETITEQLSSLRSTHNKSRVEPGNPVNMDIQEDSNNGKSDYINSMIKLLKDGLSPEDLKEVQQQLSKESSQANNQTSPSGPMFSSDRDIWETIKDVPVEKLFDQLQYKLSGNKDTQADYSEKQQELREIFKNSDQAVRFLDSFKVPSTPANILQVNMILSNGESPIKKLLKQQKENNVENSESNLKKLSELSDKLIDKTSMNEAYEKLEEEAKAELDKSFSEDAIDSIKLTDRKNITAQLSLLKTLAGKEFYQIPIETENGVTNMNLTILHNAEVSGKVSAVITSDRLGTVKADFTLKDQKLKGFIRCGNRDGLECVQKNITELEKTAGEDGITVSQLDFGMQMKGHEVYSYQDPDDEAQNVPTNSDTERKLYRIARAMVLTVKAAERTAAEANYIAS